MLKMKFVAGHASLDFVNTVGARVSRAGSAHDYADKVLRDKLADYQALITWSELAGILSIKEIRSLRRAARLHPQHAARALARALRLREALYRIFKSLIVGWRPRIADVNVLRKELRAARARQRLLLSGAGFVWRWDDSENALDSPLWRVSQSAADLLTSANLRSLRQCGGDECGWMFLDTSRNRSRRWCDMKECGNRAKVRRFREGHK
jgi:predicted RNA-binding Zn ribbon-like protein